MDSAGSWRDEEAAVWWRGRRHATDAAAQEPPQPVVLAVTEPLTSVTAERLSGEVTRLGEGRRVVVDLTAIPSFDSDGAEKLVGLQDRVGADHLTIVGLRQATARLTGAAEQQPMSATSAGGWTVRRLRNLAVVQATGEVDPDALESPLSEALEQDVAIVVCDLRGSVLSDAGAGALAFASSAAAVRGQELLVVNVGAPDVRRLRGLGLSATTYVAPET